jgi:DNA-directed RNA polymerase specialized sigma subunit
MHEPDEHLHAFAGWLEVAIDRYGDLSEETIVERQKRQLEALDGLEEEFRRTLIAHKWGKNVYRDFVSFIRDEKENILAARPYFRERQKVFTKRISPVLKERDWQALQEFHFNYNFVRFVIHSRKWWPGSRIFAIYQEIVNIRRDLILMNLPLVITRSKIFKDNTPPAHLSYMDFIQIASEGLISAVDKFVLPYDPKFRNVAIGRMIGNFIENYSETVLHFFPSDKRKIYRANKILRRWGRDNIDFEKLAEEVNQDPKKPGKLIKSSLRTNAEEISGLVAASSTVLASAYAGAETEGGDEEPLDNMATAPIESNPDHRFEKEEALDKMRNAIYQRLSLREIKLLRMRGLAL